MTMGELPVEVLDAILVHLSGLDDADLIAIHKGVGPNPPQINFPEDPDEEEDGSASEWSRTEESGSDETGSEEFPLNTNRPGAARPNRRGIFLSLPKDTRDDIINFSVINRKFCGVFRDRFRVNHIFKMPEEILRIILDYLTPELDHLLAPHLRESLSVESFASIPHVPQNFSQISELVSWSISAS
jgi:hypothetical protein